MLVLWVLLTMLAELCWTNLLLFSGQWLLSEQVGPVGTGFKWQLCGIQAACCIQGLNEMLSTQHYRILHFSWLWWVCLGEWGLPVGVVKYVAKFIFGVSFKNLLCLLPNIRHLFSDSNFSGKAVMFILTHYINTWTWGLCLYLLLFVYLYIAWKHFFKALLISSVWKNEGKKCHYIA